MNARLYNVPPIPLNYLPRPEALEALKQIVLKPGASKVALIGRSLRVGIYGMGGLGKTVLAGALARDEETARLFQDGIYWLNIGQTPNLIACQEQLYRAVSGEPRSFSNQQQGRADLDEILKDKSCLIILDDLWTLEQARAFDLQSPGSCLLVTTRNASITQSFAAESFSLDVLTEAEALQLLGEWSGQSMQALPAQAKEVAKECGYLPLALAMIGAMIHQNPESWDKALYRLRNADLDKLLTTFPDYDHPNLLRALAVSVDALPETLRDLYKDFAIFPEDTPVSQVVIKVLWAERGLNQFDVEDALSDLINRSLIIGNMDRKYWLHDLQGDYVHSQAQDDLQKRHQKLIDAYRRQCRGVWSAGPDDGYYYQQLPYHLAEAGEEQALKKLLLDFDWIEKKLSVAGVSSLISDYGLVGEEDKAVSLLQGALRLAAPVLAIDAYQLPAQLLGRLLGHKDGELAMLLKNAQEWRKKAWLRPESACLTPPRMDLLEVFVGHQSQVKGALLLPDGQWVLSWSADCTLRLWDLASGQVLHELEGHLESVRGALLLPDRQRVLSWSDDHNLRLWDLASQQTECVLKGHQFWVNGALLLPDGWRALSWSTDHTLRLWDLDSGQTLQLLKGHKSSVEGALLLPDGQRALSWSADHTLRLWDLGRGQVLQVFKGHQSRVNGALLLPDGQRALSWSGDRTLRLWDLGSRQTLLVLKGHQSQVKGALLLLDGQRALSWSYDGSLRLWDLQTGLILQVLKGHQSRVMGALLLPDGRRVLSWSWDRTLCLWDLGSGQAVHYLEGHQDWVLGALLLPDGQRALSWSADRTLRLWDLGGGQVERVSDEHRFWAGNVLPLALRLYGPGSRLAEHWLEAHRESARGALLLPDGQQALSWSPDYVLRLWDLNSGQVKSVLEGDRSHVLGALLLPDGRGVLSWSVDRALRLWDLGSGLIVRYLVGHNGWVNGALLLPDGQRALSWSNDGTLHLWDLVSEQTLPTLTGHQGGVLGALLLSDGQRALSWSTDRTLRLWNLGSWQEECVLEGHQEMVRGALLLPDGQRVLSWSLDHTLRLWDLASGQTLQVLEGERYSVKGALLLPDGQQALSWSTDRTLRLWDLQRGQVKRVLEGHQSRIEGALLLLGGQQALSWSYDGNLQLWNIVNEKRLVSFTGDRPISACIANEHGDRLIVFDTWGGMFILSLINAIDISGSLIKS